ncbi:MAG: hypothetical protein ABI605_23985 [Rhizobacter sp.]
MKPVFWKTTLCICLLAAPFGSWATTPVAIATIVDGEAVVIRDAARLQLAEGVRLVKDDIVETTAKGRLVRVEFNDGVIFDLGPETRTLLSPKLSGDKGRAQSLVHVLNGIVKVTVPKGHPPAESVISSPAYDVTGMVRSAVFLVQPTGAYAFAESGELVLQERQLERNGSRPGSIFSLKSGEFFAHPDGAKAGISGRPTAAFIQRLPRPFTDALPSRAALFKDRAGEPKRLGDIAYADVSDWLDADGLRAGFVLRFKAQAQDAEFRKGLIAGLRAHPEWDRTLYPEKYLPKPAASAASHYGATP